MSYFQAQAAIWLAPAFQPTMIDSSEAITALVEEYATTLYRVAYSVTRNVAEAEDAVQETFLRVLRHRDKLAEIRDQRVWLVRIVWNVVLDKKRRAKTRPETDDIGDHVRTLRTAGFGADQQAISSEEYRRILSLIDQLPQKERDAILLSAVEELSTAQAAAVLGTTESSVRSRIFRARRALSELLAREGIER